MFVCLPTCLSAFACFQSECSENHAAGSLLWMLLGLVALGWEKTRPVCVSCAGSRAVGGTRTLWLQYTAGRARERCSRQRDPLREAPATYVRTSAELSIAWSRSRRQCMPRQPGMQHAVSSARKCTSGLMTRGHKVTCARCAIASRCAAALPHLHSSCGAREARGPRWCAGDTAPRSARRA